MKSDLPQKTKTPTRALTGITELNYDSATSRHKLKGYFIERDKAQMREYIKDLEKTILINKGIIRNLIAESCKNDNFKEALRLLNEENMKIQQKLNKTIRERDNFQSQLLIAEQIIEDSKGKKSTYEDQLNEKNQELLDQLNKKEYALQSYENKFYALLSAIKRYMNNNEGIADIVSKLTVKIDKSKNITNVVKENNTLIGQIQYANKRITELEEEVSELKGLKKLMNFANEEKDLIKVATKKMEENEKAKSALKELQSKNENISQKLTEDRKSVV